MTTTAVNIKKLGVVGGVCLWTDFFQDTVIQKHVAGIRIEVKITDQCGLTQG